MCIIFNLEVKLVWDESKSENPKFGLNILVESGYHSIINKTKNLNYDVGKSKNNSFKKV
jgi:hypothetical protein